MGRVYEAIHRPSGRHVALKMMRSAHSGAAAQRGLLDEAAAVMQLRHPGIVELLDVGRDDGGGIFLVMELVHGADLEGFLLRWPGWPAVRAAFSQLLEALAAAHAQGIVHGDLKPANVLLAQDGRVKITDFGIAYVTDPIHGTRTRNPQGTPYYMAPEQFGTRDPVGPYTDLYAIGVMLYELVAGRPPFAMDGSVAEVLGRKLHGRRPLAAREGLVVPGALVAMIEGLMDADPLRRPRFAAEVRRELLRWDDAVIEARPSVLSLSVLAGPTDPGGPVTIADAPVVNAPTEHAPVTPALLTPTPLSEPAAHRALPFALPATSARELGSLRRLRPTALVGRGPQIERLMTAVNEVSESGGTSLVAFVGRAGEGKSRLARHGLAEVERMGKMLGAAAGFDISGTSVTGSLQACVRRLLGAPVAGSTPEETAAGRWRWLLEQEPGAFDVAAMHRWLSADAAPVSAETTVDLAHAALRAMSRRRPVYLWLDDAGWSRDGALQLAERLLRAQDARLLLVLTLRSGTAEHPSVRSWLDRIAEAPRAGVEELRPLSVDERARLLGEVLPLAGDVARALAERLDETPLLLREALLDWVDAKELLPGDQGYVLRPGLTLDALASRPHAGAIERRLDAVLAELGEDAGRAERLLWCAALLGARFEERPLRHRERSREREGRGLVDRVLDRALLSGIVRVEGPRTYRFDHGVLQELLLARLEGSPHRATVLRETADALRGAYGRRVDTSLRAAVLYRQARAEREAYEALFDATTTLSRASLLDDADAQIAEMARWVEQDAVPAVDVRRALLHRTRGIRRYFALDYASAREEYARAGVIYARLGDVRGGDALRYEESSTYFYEERLRECEDIVLGMLARGLEDVELACKVQHRIAELRALSGDLDGALRHERKALEHCLAAEDGYRTFVMHATIAELLLASGRLDEVPAVVARIEALLHEIHDPHLALDVDDVHMHVAVVRGDYATAEPQLAERAARLAAIDDRWRVTSTLAFHAVCVAAVGTSEDAAGAARRFLEAYARVHHDEPLTFWAMRKLEALLRERGVTGVAGEVASLLRRREEEIRRAFAA